MSAIWTCNSRPAGHAPHEIVNVRVGHAPHDIVKRGRQDPGGQVCHRCRMFRHAEHDLRAGHAPHEIVKPGRQNPARRRVGLLPISGGVE